MVARIWRGWTAADTADAYAAHLGSIAEDLGALVLRRRLADGVEFMSLTVWESRDALDQAGCPEDHHLLVGRQSIPADWEVVTDALRTDDTSGILERIVAA
jgi:hypothetical protein